MTSLVPLNALSPMDVTLAGIVIVFSELQENASSPIVRDSLDAANVTEERLFKSAKAFSPIEVTFGGILIVANDVP